MSKLGKPVDLDHFLNRAKNRIYRVGIELEGGWDELPSPDVAIVHDGSVRFGGGVAIPRRPNGMPIAEYEQAIQPYRELQRREGMFTPRYVGEIPSPPLGVDEFVPWLRRYYPPHVNATCGLHVHMSFRHALSYQRVMVKEFPATVIEYIRRWATERGGFPQDHHIWGRLNGSCEYCKHTFYADAQARAKKKGFDRNAPGNRYSVIHYSYALHGTAECRLLPMMENVEIAIDAVNTLLRITNAFLLARARKDPAEIVEVPAEGNAIREEIIECV